MLDLALQLDPATGRCDLVYDGRDLVLDASGVQRLGGLCLQVLLSAARTWAADGVNLRLGSVSQPLGEQWAAFGAPDLINEGAQA